MRAQIMLASLVAQLVTGSALAQGVELSPQRDDDLQTLLDGLARRQLVSRWCQEGCASFFEVRLSGRLERGELTFEVSGSVGGAAQALVPLFALSPVRDLFEAMDAGGRAVPLYFVGESYAALLPAGDFRLRGVARFERNAALTLRVAGPAGHVSIDVADADVAGSGARRGVSDATYQLAPVVRDAPQASRDRQLRLETTRSFELARDKTFTVEVQARGARPGQIIPLALAPGEKVEGFDESLGRLVGEEGSQRIEWVAQGPEATLSYGGIFTGATIELVAPAGAVRETWRVRCDDPYECAFSGDAEVAPAAQTRVWAPLPGQRLTVSWRELSPLSGVHTAAQAVALTSRPVAGNLEQSLQVDWQSSSGSLVSVALPQGALVSRFALDGTEVPMLKDEQGALRVTLPSSRSRLRVDWKLAGEGGLVVSPPVPRLSAPIGTFWHDVRPAPGRAPLLVGGLAGSPRVELWPNLGAALLLASLAWLLARLAGAPVASTWMWMVSALGFAIVSPLAVLPLVLTFALTRWLGNVRAPRGRLRAVFEVATLAGLALAALGAILTTLDAALLSSTPIEVTSFVSAPALADTGADFYRLTWGTYLAPRVAADALPPSPWVVFAPVVLLRVLWAAWAIVVALLLLREGRGALAAMARYFEAVTRPKPS